MSPTERVARFAGWKQRGELDLWKGWWDSPTKPKRTLAQPPDFTTLADWQPVYREIERRGLAASYVSTLFVEAIGNVNAVIRQCEEETAMRWAYITATADQRIAALCNLLDRIEGKEPTMADRDAVIENIQREVFNDQPGALDRVVALVADLEYRLSRLEEIVHGDRSKD